MFLINRYMVKTGTIKNILTLIFLALIWGSSFILIKKGLLTFSPDHVGNLRIAFAYIVLLPVALKYLKKYFREYWWKFLLLGLISNLIPAILFALAETGLSSSVTGILNSLTPIFTLLVGGLFFSITFEKRKIIGLTLGLAGSVILTFVGSSGGFGNFNYYVLYVLVATICYGFGANMVKNFFPKINSLIFTSLAVFFVGPLSIIYLIATDAYLSMGHEYAYYSLFYIFILGSVGTATALVIFNKLIQNTTAVFASTVTYLIPVAAVMWGIFDGESLYPAHAAGTLFIISGVYFVNKNR